MTQRASSQYHLLCCAVSLIASSRFPEVDKISPPLLQLSGVDFGYTPEKQILKNVYIDIGLDSRIAVVGANGAGR
jgi:ATP-binding cassette, subfamily F, member 3